MGVMTMVKQLSQRDEMIDEAARVIYSAHNDALSMGQARMIARSVLATFEQAPTATDDEREAWITVRPNGAFADIWSNEDDAATYGSGERVEHVTILRRTVQGEPSRG
jgi:type II secretory pathway pseudopilin PulG